MESSHNGWCGGGEAQPRIKREKVIGYIFWTPLRSTGGGGGESDSPESFENGSQIGKLHILVCAFALLFNSDQTASKAIACIGGWENYSLHIMAKKISFSSCDLLRVSFAPFNRNTLTLPCLTCVFCKSACKVSWRILQSFKGHIRLPQVLQGLKLSP